MKRSALWVMAVGMIALAAVVRGQELELRTEVEADRTTPRGTLKVLSTAMRKADTDTLRSILSAGNESETRMVEAMVQTATAVRKLHDAAISAYGQEQAIVLTGPAPAEDGSDLEYLDEASETIDGDRATVTFADVEARPVKLVRNGEQWQVPVGELAADLNAGSLEARVSEITTFNGIIEAVAEEITLKKHRTAEEAKQAMYNRMMQAAAPEAAPATQPTTAPASSPAPEAISPEALITTAAPAAPETPAISDAPAAPATPAPSTTAPTASEPSAPAAD